MSSSMFKHLSRVTLILGFLSSTSWAYLDVLDTGEILPRGTYKLTGDTQLMTDVGGLNAEAAFDAGFQDQYGVRALVGFGRTDYFVGGMAKWMPIPDVEGQPAMGLNTGLIYGHQDGLSNLTIRFEPLLSKHFNINGSIVTPYAALPFGPRFQTSSTVSNTDLSWQLAVGSQLQVERWKNLQFIGEVGVAFAHAPSYVTVGALFYFDDQHGFEWK